MRAWARVRDDRGKQRYQDRKRRRDGLHRTSIRLVAAPVSIAFAAG
jgi:hypothetical protein